MNAKIILAAIAAVCCVQGISAASLARPMPLPWFDNDAVAADFDLDNVNLEEVFETMILSLENELTVASEQKGTRNIVACGVSITNLFKTLWEDKGLYDEYKTEKKLYEQTAKNCAADTNADTSAKCIDANEQRHKEAMETIKAKLFPLAVKNLTSALALKNCFL